MSGHTIAAVMTTAGVSLLVAAALVVIAVAYVYQGGHARPLEAEPKDRKRARVYHRLNPDERREWRQNDGVPVA